MRRLDAIKFTLVLSKGGRAWNLSTRAWRFVGGTLPSMRMLRTRALRPRNAAHAWLMTLPSGAKRGALRHTV